MKMLGAIILASLMSLNLGFFTGSHKASGVPSQPLSIKTLSALRSQLPQTPAYDPSNLMKDLHALNRLHHSQMVTVVMASQAMVKALSDYSAATSTPGNSLYHHFLTPSQLMRQFGPSPSRIAEVSSAVRAVGWSVISHNGFLLTARIPASSTSRDFPISPDIWSVEGITPVSTVPDTAVTTPKRAEHTAVHTPLPKIPSYSTEATAANSAFDFPTSPALNLPFYTANGDQVDVLSWNPGILSSLPAGLPFNLIVAATNANGSPLAITSIDHISDSAGDIGYYGSGSSFPASNNALWQLRLAAWHASSTSDTVSFNVALSDGQSISVSLALPPFTGTADILDPLTGSQLSTIAGASQVVQNSSPATRPAVAIMDLGQLPNPSDLATSMDAQGLPMPTVQYFYENGATPSMTNTTDAIESNLDIQAVASVDPGATILEYCYPNPSYEDPLASMLNVLSQQSVAKIASISYQIYSNDPQTLAPLVEACTAEGITLLMASGDFGAYDGSSNTNVIGVSTGDAESGITTVGGLNMAAPATYNSSNIVSSVTGMAIDKAWGGDFLNGLPVSVTEAYLAANRASSGGFATTSVPSWQTGFLPANAPGLGVPDIASLAGSPGLMGVFQGQPIGWGGTSLAAPLTAGWLADLEGTPQMASPSPGLGNINPILFGTALSHPHAFVQGEWGADGIYSVNSSQPGTWNPVTGLGQAQWDLLSNLWSTQTVSTFEISGISGTVQAGNPITLQVTAMTANQSPVTDFSGVASVYTSDSAAQFPSQISFVNGTAQFNITFSSPGSQTVTVSDPALSPPVTATTPSFMVQSPLTLSVSNLQPTVGNTVTVTASAPLNNPQYQFWVYDPATNVWANSGPFSTNNGYSIREEVPGNYQWIVYAKPSLASTWSYYTKATTTYVPSAGHPMVSNLSVSTPAIQENSGASATFTAQAVDPNGQPLYQFWVHGPDNRWVLAQNYSATPSFTLSELPPGSYTVAVYALDAADVSKGLWHDAYYYDTVVNVASSVVLNSPSQWSTGQPLTVSASAAGITDPVYQFWVEDPGGVWIQRGFGSSTYTFSPTSPGTYTVAVYAKDPNALALPAYTVMSDQTVVVQ